MIIKVTLLFLVAMMVLGMFGKLRVPKLRRGKPEIKAVESAKKCKTCGAYVIGAQPKCGRSDCPHDRSA